jgi:tetratricopeptide (TPR) repeat protein
MRSVLGISLLTLTAMTAACASAPIRKQDEPALAQADARVREGCYDCLIEARTTYARLAVGKARPLIVGRLFETEVLIALREKELALDSAGSIARARALVPELPPVMAAERVLAILDGVPADNYGTPRQELLEFRQTRAAFIKGLTAELAWLGTAPLAVHFRQYLALSLDCSYRMQTPTTRGPRAREPRIDVPADAPPLVRYRDATCGEITSRLEPVRVAVPGFIETSYFLGRSAIAMLQQRGDLGRTRALVEEAYRRFPQSPAVTYMTGSFSQIAGDCRAALGYYDQTIVLKPRHEDALLGRTMCLSFLKRTDEAIAAATHMIDLKTDNVIEAFYWRAWNHHFRQALAPAREDITRAKSMGSNGRIHTLAGVIEHDQDDLDPSEQDLRIALGMSGGSRNCTAMWYLGLVMMKRSQWIRSAQSFEQSAACYELNVNESLAGLEKIKATPDLDPEFRAQQIAGFEAALVEDRRQYYAAAFNAANHYARGGNLDKARFLVDIAAKDPSLAQRVDDLRKILKLDVPPLPARPSLPSSAS